MAGPPEDPTARRDALERWVSEQAEEGRIAKPSGPRKTLAHRLRRFADRLLDRGLDTSEPAVGPEHDHPDRNVYGASAWHVLPRALRYLGVSEADTFVDFGAGKGRVLHQAAKHPFRRVIGIEISPELARAARSGLDANKHRYRCKDVEVVVADAADYRVPDDMTIAYFFHPFRGETLDAVLRNIIDSIDRNPRLVRLIYVRPEQPERILATGRFRLVKEQHSRLLDTSLSYVGSLSQVSIFEGR